MADLFDRMFPADPSYELKIPVEFFGSAINDYAMGYTTRPQIINFFNLDAEAQADLAVLCDAIDLKNPNERVIFCFDLLCVCRIVESGARYTTKATFRDRLGLGP